MKNGMASGETADIRRKRLRLRAWRRGTREMDLILGSYADRHLATMDVAALAAFDALLDENDHDLLQWVLGQGAAPAPHAPLIAALAGFAAKALGPSGRSPT